MHDGFPPLCFSPVAAGGVPPWGQDMNGILNQITAWNQWQQAGAPIVYDSTFQTAIGGYPQGAVVKLAANGPAFMSTVDNNTVAPAVGATGWMPVPIFGGNVATITSTSTLTAINSGLVLVNATSGNINITLPTVASESGIPLQFQFIRTDTSSNTVTVTAAGSDTFFPGGASSASVTVAGQLQISGNGVSQWINMALQFPSSLTANGWKKYPDPNSPTGYYIEQWGNAGIPSNGTGPDTTDVTLPIAYPTAHIWCIANWNGASPPATGGVAAAPVNLGSIRLTVNAPASASNGVAWYSKGY